MRYIKPRLMAIERDEARELGVKQGDRVRTDVLLSGRAFRVCGTLVKTAGGALVLGDDAILREKASCSQEKGS